MVCWIGFIFGIMGLCNFIATNYAENLVSTAISSEKVVNVAARSLILKAARIHRVILRMARAIKFIIKPIFSNKLAFNIIHDRAL